MSQQEQEARTWVLELTENDFFSPHTRNAGLFWQMGKLHQRLNRVSKQLETDHIFDWHYTLSTTNSVERIEFLGRMDISLTFTFNRWEWCVWIMGHNKGDDIFEATPELILKIGNLLIGKHCKRELKVETYEEFQKRKEEDMRKG